MQHLKTITARVPPNTNGSIKTRRVKNDLSPIKNVADRVRSKAGLFSKLLPAPATGRKWQRRFAGQLPRPTPLTRHWPSPRSVEAWLKCRIARGGRIRLCPSSPPHSMPAWRISGGPHVEESSDRRHFFPEFMKRLEPDALVLMIDQIYVEGICPTGVQI